MGKRDAKAESLGRCRAGRRINFRYLELDNLGESQGKPFDKQPVRWASRLGYVALSNVLEADDNSENLLCPPKYLRQRDDDTLVDIRRRGANQRSQTHSPIR